MSKGKANAQGWIRHKGKKMPVSACKLVEIRTRGGDFEVCRASGFNWAAEGEDQIMAYRLHQPDQAAGHVEAKSAEPGMPSTTKIDGPIQWRDRINEIDRTAESLEKERVSLVQRLADEGLQLIGKKAEAAESLPDMSNPDNWKRGDLVKALKESDSSYFKAGGIYTLREDCERGHVRVKRDEAGQENGWGAHNFKWHSRPSNPA